MNLKAIDRQFNLSEQSLTTCWRVAEITCLVMLISALLFLGFALIFPAESAVSTASMLLLAPLNLSMLALISFIALIVVRYARSNFTADPDSARFLLWLGLTIIAVMVTVVSNHLLLFWLAWMSISLSLHQLLMFYPDRPRAALAAHKKFILARFAELLLGSALLLLYLQHETAFISEILAAYPKDQLTSTEQLVAVLLALVALIKCAQLPLHGWLIQVVESPTPVSALLHAGVINLGGFLLLQFSPLFAQAVLAQWIVLVIAGLSAVLAALVMVTRISIKVRLAWSTTAQMGLMLVQCALGLYELALLHLLAHSCYKAHAFLGAGGEVNRWLMRQLVARPLPTVSAWIFAGVTTVTVVLAAKLLPGTEQLISPWVVLTLALLVVLALRFEPGDTAAQLRSVALAVGIVTLYSVLQLVTQRLAPDTAVSVHWSADLWVSVLVTGLLVAYLFLQYEPRDRQYRHLFIALNAGFYLDEWASHWTLRLWPAQLPRTKKLATHTQEAHL